MNLQPETIQTLREGLRQVVSGGSAIALNVPNLQPVAGKTGTTEDQPRPNHAWFGGFAPFDDPEVLVVAFTQNSGGGGAGVAVPMVKEVLEAYFKLKASES
jgi:penicillin-binding protein 2